MQQIVIHRHKIREEKRKRKRKKQANTSESLVQLDLPDLPASRVQRVLHVYLCRVVGVGAELHGAVLPVERKILYLSRKYRGCCCFYRKKKHLTDKVFGFHLYSTRTTVESWRSPGYPAVAINLDVDLQRHFKHSIVTANKIYVLNNFYFLYLPSSNIVLKYIQRKLLEIF